MLSATTFGTFLREFSPPEVCARQFFLQLGARFDKPDSMRFSGLSATDERMVRLKYLTKLRSLGLDESKVTDAGLEHFKGLAGLKTLYLDDTKVTDKDVRNLQQALPNCKISH